MFIVYVKSVYKLHVLTPSPTPPLKGGEEVEEAPLKGGAILLPSPLRGEGKGEGVKRCIYIRP